MELSETDYKKAIEEQQSEVHTMVLLSVDNAGMGIICAGSPFLKNFVPSRLTAKK